MTARLVVLASGSGTLLQSLLDACADRRLNASVALVVSDVADAQALARAASSGADTACISPADFPDRSAWNAAMVEAVSAASPDWVVSAGFMRILGPAFVDAFSGRIINTHPALLPSFPGAHGVRDALDYGVMVTGCTVHLVDHGVDTGPILAQRAVEVLPDDDEASLHERIKVIERTLLVHTLNDLIGESRD